MKKNRDGRGGLVLTLKLDGEGVYIGEGIYVTAHASHAGRQVKLRIVAPRDITISREKFGLESHLEWQRRAAG